MTPKKQSKPSFGEKMKALKEQKQKEMTSIDLKQPRLDKTIEIIKQNPRI